MKDDDPDNLAELARGHAADWGSESLDALAWSAIADLLSSDSLR